MLGLPPTLQPFASLDQLLNQMCVDGAGGLSPPAPPPLTLSPRQQAEVAADAAAVETAANMASTREPFQHNLPDDLDDLPDTLDEEPSPSRAPPTSEGGPGSFRSDAVEVRSCYTCNALCPLVICSLIAIHLKDLDSTLISISSANGFVVTG